MFWPDRHPARIDWGDDTPYGVGIVTGGPANATIQASHVYEDSGSFTISVIVTDDDGDVSTDAIQVTVANVAPELRAVPDQDVNTLVTSPLAWFCDPGLADTRAATIDWGDGVVETGDLFQWRGSGVVDGSHSYQVDGVYTVRIVVSDDDGGTDEATFQVTAHVTNQSPVVIVDVPITIFEGDEAFLAFAFTDANPDDVHTATIDWDNGNPAEMIPLANDLGQFGTAFPTRRYLDDVDSDLTFTVCDQGTLCGSGVSHLVVQNRAPGVEAGENREAAVGEAVDLVALFSDLGVLDTHTATIDWGDGAQSLATISEASGSGTAAGQHAYTHAGTYTAVVTVTDDDHGTAVDTLVITVTGSTLEAAISGPVDGVRGQSRTFTLSADDGAGVPTTLYTFALDWDGNGTTDQTVIGSSGTSIDNVFPASGTYNVRLTVSHDGQTATATHAIAITTAAIQSDDCCGGMVLVVGGTSGDDTIVIQPANSGRVEVVIGGVSQGVFAPSFRIVVFAQSGDDDVQVAGSIGLSAWLYGDGGRDRLQGGSGDDVLIGGDGDDQPLGGSGQDLIIGGLGSDRLIGNADDDLLIAGTTAFDRNEQALCAILHEWTSGRSVDARVANLRGTGSGRDFTNRANGHFYLKTEGSDATVFDDRAADVLTGSAGRDWFFANLAGGVLDKLTDRHPSESDELN